MKKCAWIAGKYISKMIAGRNKLTVVMIEFSNVEEHTVKSVILDIVEKSAQGWDQVIQSLVQLAMGLIDTAASQGVWSKAGSVTKTQRNKDGPMENVMALGNEILKRMFEVESDNEHIDTCVTWDISSCMILFDPRSLIKSRLALLQALLVQVAS